MGIGLAVLAIQAGCDARTAPAEDRLVESLVALHLLEAREAEVGDVPPSVRDSVLSTHGWTPENFRARMNALAADPPRAESVYARVQRRLSALPRHAPLADSLAR